MDLLAKVLSRFTYKPGWEFVLFEGSWGPVVDFRLRVIDADAPHQYITITAQHTPSPSLATDERYILNWLRAKIIEIEKHEVDEFFQIEGVKIFDPH